MTTIRVKDNSKTVKSPCAASGAPSKLGLLTDLRPRVTRKPTAERKRKKAAAVKRHYKRIALGPRLPKRLY